MYDPIEHDFNSWSDREEREDALERFSYQFNSAAEDLLLDEGWSSDDEGWSSDDEGFESEVHSLALELAEQEIEEAKRELEADQKEIYESRYDNYYN